jgi:uncharacterized protein (DUF1330 family)
MGDESKRYVMLMGLQVIDQASYSRYRSSMTPILQSYGGAFGYDFVVEKVLKGRGNDQINRVFTISFPDRSSRERFFADEKYQAVRSELFEPAVASATVLAEFESAEL